MPQACHKLAMSLSQVMNVQASQQPACGAPAITNYAN